MTGFVWPLAMVWPLAKADEFVGTLIVFAIFLISVIAQLITKARENQKKAGQRKPPVPPPAGEKQDPLADEIEEFLKRAAQRRQATGGGRRTAPPPMPMAAVPEVPPAESSRRLVQAPVEVELIPLEGEPQSVAAHVSELLSAAKFVPVTQELGKEVTELDSRMQRHLQERFDQRVGRLTGLGGESATAQAAVDLEPGAQPAAGAAGGFSGLATLLANPGSVRQAIVFSEIFNRPESRWD
jgi:hypothetical protein